MYSRIQDHTNKHMKRFTNSLKLKETETALEYFRLIKIDRNEKALSFQVLSSKSFIHC